MYLALYGENSYKSNTGLGQNRTLGDRMLDKWNGTAEWLTPLRVIPEKMIISGLRESPKGIHIQEHKHT